jgi:hypothetical protein
VSTTRKVEMKNAGIIRAAGLVLLTIFAVQSTAHHSFAMFDQTKTITQKGTVKEVQWTNPHVWLHLTVQVEGKDVDYAYEGAAVAVLKRVGWMRDSVKPGDVVTVVGNPYKGGQRTGGAFNYIILPDGKHLGTGDAIPGALVPKAK